MTTWEWLVWCYLAIALLTLIPTLTVLITGVKLNEGGASFAESRFSPQGKERLAQHFSRLQGTLAFWKRDTSRSRRFHYYCVSWTIVSSSLMPFLTQAIDESDPASKWFLTTVAAHIVLLLGFHRGLKVEERFKAFRHGESEFYDTYRRLLDRPEAFGDNEEEQIAKYFDEVQVIRRFVRSAETDSIPLVQDVRDRTSKAGGGSNPSARSR